MKLICNLSLGLVLGGLLFVTGCGGGGSQQDNSSSTAPSNAPESIAAKSLTVNEIGGPGPQVWQFTTTGTWDEFTSGARTRTGNYQYSRSGDNGNLVISAGTTNEVLNVTLMFTNATSGTFTYTTTPTHRTGGGTFSGLGAIAGNPAGNPGTPTTTGTNNTALPTLNGKTVLVTKTQVSSGASGQTHTLVFGLDTFSDSNPPESARGSYSYTPNGSVAGLLLNYTATSVGGQIQPGDQDALTMTYVTTNSGTFTGTLTSGTGTNTVTSAGNFQVQ